VTAELPGMTEKEIEVAVSDGMLTLKGEKRQEKEQKDKNLYLSERSHGSFQRSFAVPENVDRGKIAADFAKGHALGGWQPSSGHGSRSKA
jgi:HSP20 family protein